MQSEKERIEAALAVAAQLVALHGERFLPVFLRLEAEAESIAGRNSALERALSMSHPMKGAA